MTTGRQRRPCFVCLATPHAVARLLGIGVLLVGLLLPSPKCALAAETNAEEAQVVSKLDDLVGKGKYAEAIPLAQRLVADTERKYGANNTNVASCLNSLAAFYYRTADYSKAEPLFQRSLKIREKQLG